jgi:hypothetical protein
MATPLLEQRPITWNRPVTRRPRGVRRTERERAEQLGDGDLFGEVMLRILKG